MTKHAHTVAVLMYHHVSPSAGAITCSPQNFEDQLRWLRKHGYTSLTTAEFEKHLNGQGVPKRSVLITFDDGYLDNWVYAYPLLKKYGFNAVLFLVTSWAGKGSPRPVLGASSLPVTPSHEICKQSIAQGQSDDVIIRWSEAQAMQQEGVFEIHSHTHTHTRWDQRDPENKNRHMKDELLNSRVALIENIGEASPHFCWPQGYFDADYQVLAQEAGFRYLYTTQAFGQNTATSSPLNIYRFAVRNTTGTSVGRRIWVAETPWVAPVFNGWKRWKRSFRQ